MFTKTILFFAAALLTVQAKILHPSDATERKKTCSKILAQACPGSADTIPFAYPPEAKGIDEACSAASTFFPCFKKYASSCDTNDVESNYFLTYLEVCDSSNPLYDGIRKSIKCLKKAEKKYNETCIEPMGKLVVELNAFGKKINDFSISAGDWQKIEFGLTVRMEQVCFLQISDECNIEFVSTMEILFDRFGATKATAILSKKPEIAKKVLDNLDLDDKHKKMLKNSLG